MARLLWEPSPERVAAARLTAFMRRVSDFHGVELADHRDLWEWSIDHVGEFWNEVWQFAGVVGERGRATLANGNRMPGARFFPDASLNFAENLLRGRGSGDAIVFSGEGERSERISWDRLRSRVAATAALLRESGIQRGDRVAGYLPNHPEAIVGMLATASLGAVWTSSSPDFGPRGVVDRFGQVEPRVLFTADGYRYKGRSFDSLARVREILPELPTVEQVLVVPYLTDPDESDDHERVAELGRTARWLPDARSAHVGQPLSFEPIGFNDPLYVLYSSGTTGPPKCIVHGAGGTLLKHLCEHQLMCDVRPDDRVFYFTTCGWMMWNWLASALASRATLLLFDGNPFHPGPEALFDFFAAERGTLFGTSAKYIDALRNAGARPGGTHDLSSLRTLTSTGSPLMAEGFDYVYEHVKADVCLASIAGGTDIVGCFVGGNPIGPVWRGEIQSRSLGMAVDIYDQAGRSLRGQKGELVCTKPFPSMPLGFWDDPDTSRYRSTYFERYPGVWHHGDFAELTEHDGVVIYGRSDATLNPGGVRIGTAEIYRVVEDVAEIEEALVIGQDWEGDVRVVLFVRMAPDAELTSELESTIRHRVREQCSPRHVPARILQVTDIPRTRSGKIVELAVREMVHGRPVLNIEALANPEALEQFADRAELRG